MSGTPVATGYTLDFVLANLPGGARDILEVGCGDGELAQRLGEHGFAVVALDLDEACVASAKARGVDALAAEWPADLGRQFDALLFTRSLHHVQDLAGGVAAARRALRPGGRIIVEDFRAEGGSARGAAWFTGLTKTLFAAGAFRDEFDLDQTLAKIGPGDHGHRLHSSGAIAGALRSFGNAVASDGAYYFRYLESELRCEEPAAQALLEHELELIAQGCIDPLGKRFVADS